MIIIMMISGLLSSMYIWCNKFSDIRFSVNDLYMISLMTAWMCFFMSIIDSNKVISIISIISIVIILFSIRKQYFVNLKQYYTGMIPHHSMALLTSRNVLLKQGLKKEDRDFIQSIIDTQENEITYMKNRLNTL